MHGVVYHLTGPLRRRGGWRGTVANVLTLLVFSAVAAAVLALGVRMTPR